jgi:excisionase family DNA binding protein
MIENQLTEIIKSMAKEALIEFLRSEEGRSIIAEAQAPVKSSLIDLDSLIERYPFFSKSTIYKKVHQKTFPVHRDGKKLLFSIPEIEEYLSKGPPEKDDPPDDIPVPIESLTLKKRRKKKSIVENNRG